MTLAPFAPPLLPTPTVSSRSLRLPEGVRASRGLPTSESAAFTVVVPLLALPLLVATMGALPVIVVALALTTAVGWLCRAQRTAVGHDWIAHRALLRYRVTQHAHLHSAELVHNAHGGLLVLHTDHGRTHRIRYPDLEQGELRQAVSEVLQGGRAELGRGVAQALALPAAR